ncbi:uncharacterized protein LOC111262374 [Varroa jacobsoni]|uniref:uncharacterized protein LOC111262374 n=1 Tax=Varroa jacobsoni TaxID=62625 RepID=UPI000BF7CDD6|nr:uncharacterized protein LOC111262374 [Varroa jacobsoni]
MEYLLTFFGGLHRKFVQHGHPRHGKSSILQISTPQEASLPVTVASPVQPPSISVTFNPKVHITESSPSRIVSLELAESGTSSVSLFGSISKESSVVIPSEESLTTAPLSVMETDDSCRSSPPCRLPLVLNSTRGLRVIPNLPNTFSPILRVPLDDSSMGNFEVQHQNVKTTLGNKRSAALHKSSSTHSRSGSRNDHNSQFDPASVAISANHSVCSDVSCTSRCDSGSGNKRRSIGSNDRGVTALRNSSISLQQFLHRVNMLARSRSPFATPEPHVSPRSKRRRSLTRLSGEGTDTLQKNDASCNAETLEAENATKATRCTPAFINKVFLKEHVRVKREMLSIITGASQVDYAESDFVQDCLFWHNHFRRKHQAPFLLLSLHLCEQAQQLANFIAHTNDLYHRKLRDIGQNLYVESSYTQENFDVNGETVVKHWYQEQKYYDYYQNQDLLHTQASRFTQLVWKSSQKIGIGKATIGANKVIIVTLYKPAGNVVGEFHNNVFAIPIRRTAFSLGSASTSAAQSDDDSAAASPTSSLDNNHLTSSTNCEAIF